MNKDKTLEIKGIAILMMLWLHLFNTQEAMAQCQPFLYFWNGDALAHVLRKVCNICVGLYVLLGGYGLAKTYLLKGSEMHNARRVAGLYRKVWGVFLVFFPIGWLCQAEGYREASWQVVVENAMGLSSILNGEWWFLLPYAVLTLVSCPLIRRVMQAGRKTEGLILLLCLGAFAASFGEEHWIEGDGLSALLGRNILRVGHMSLYFVVGIGLVKHRVLERLVRWGEGLSDRRWNSTVAAFLLALTLLKLSIGASAILNPPFVVLYCIAFALLRMQGLLHRILTLLGINSAFMWLTHSFFINRLMAGEIYQLRYILLIYLTLVALSFVVAQTFRRIM